MRHRLQRRSNLFLMEIILAILFFSIASAVCIRLFAVRMCRVRKRPP